MLYFQFFSWGFQNLRYWDRDRTGLTYSGLDFGTGTGTKVLSVPQRDRDRDQVMSSPVHGTGTGPCSVLGLGPGLESRRALRHTTQGYC